MLITKFYKIIVGLIVDVDKKCLILFKKGPGHVAEEAQYHCNICLEITIVESDNFEHF